MEQHLQLARQVSRKAPRRWKVLRAVLLCAVLAAVLAGGERGASIVIRVRAFLEFYSGVFTLVGLSAVVVAGLAASGRFTPVRLRVLAQAAHRATAVMSMSFLSVHVLLKVLEQHASILDAVVPFTGGQERALWIGLGTIASDGMIFIFATGVARGRFIGRGRPWTWRVLHITAYLCWPVAIVHGLVAGRTPKDWVTLSYVTCLGLVVVMGLIRFVSWWRQPRAVRRLGGRATGRTTHHVPDTPTHGIPDEEFWAEFKREAQLWTVSTK
jgi:hypothetical protein